MSDEPPTANLTEAEVRRLRRLIDEDDIRQLGRLCSHYLDHGYIDRLRELFTDDVVCEFGPYGTWQGIDTVMANFEGVRDSLGEIPFVTMHAGGHHWIEFSTHDLAAGRRQLLDFALDRPANENPILWLALYEEQYRREASGWKISHSIVHFLWPERHVGANFPGRFPRLA